MKTTAILPKDETGRQPVYWLIDGVWTHKGWLMPEVTE